MQTFGEDTPLSALKVNFQISEWGMRTLAPIRRKGSCRSLSAGTKKGTPKGAFVLAEGVKRKLNVAFPTLDNLESVEFNRSKEC